MCISNNDTNIYVCNWVYALTSVFISLKGLGFSWMVTDPVLVHFKQQVGNQESRHKNVHPREHVERQEQCLEGRHLSCARALEHVLIDASWC